MDMKRGPVTKLEKRNKTTSRKIDDDVISQIVTSLSFLIYGQFGATGSRIPYEESVKRTFSLIITFYLTKTEDRTKKSLTQLLHYCFE